MKSYSASTVAELSNKVSELYDLLNTADRWINHNLKHEQKDTASLKIKNARRIVRKIDKSLESKPVFALFGASQVGKSYLVKNLLSIDGAPLEIVLGDLKYDFLREINPPGTGAESTGIVTRFTLATATNPDFPVKAKLLSIKDLVLVICDSFFSDLKTIRDYPTTHEFVQHIAEAKAMYGSSSSQQDVIIEDDIFDIKDYFEKRFYKFSHYTKQINASHFWFEVGNIIRKVPTDRLQDIFGILWNNNEALSELFQYLVSSLSKLDFSDTTYLGSEAVLRGKAEILDVQRLKELYKSDDELQVVGAGDKSYTVNKSAFCALCSEVTLPVESSLIGNKPFLEFTDLLDFPGARSRLEVAAEALNRETVPDLLLRGKVSYLFNKYSADFEINNLLFCQNDKQLDVNELPGLLNDWIETNIGETPEKRSKSLAGLNSSPLFIIFTFFNNQLKYDSTNDYKESIAYKWDTRFRRFFVDELVTKSHNWHINWTSEQSLFNNFFLLRDYKYSEDTFEGFHEKGIEKSVREDRTDFVQKLKNSFLYHEFVEDHFRNPEETINLILTPNRDGSSEIIEALLPAANNYVKVSNYLNQLRSINESVVRHLEKFHFSSDVEEQRRIALAKGVRIQLEMNRVFGKHPQLFKPFLSALMLDEVEVFNFIHDNLLEVKKVDDLDAYNLLRSQIPGLSTNNTREANLDILQIALGCSSHDEVLAYLEEQNLDFELLFPKTSTSAAGVIVEGIINRINSTLETENLALFLQSGLRESTIHDISELIKDTMQSLDFKEVLIELVREKVNGIKINRDEEEYLAASLTYSVNEFIANMGASFLDPDAITSLKESYPNILPFGIAQIDIDELPSNQTLEEVFSGNTQSGEVKVSRDPLLKSFNTFIMNTKIALLANCGFVNYDIEQNSNLKRLIDRIESLKLNGPMP